MAVVPKIDWNLAARTGKRLVPPGPAASAREIGAAVAGLRTAANRAGELLAVRSGLTAEAAAPVLVIDRERWIEANSAMAADLLARVRRLVGEQPASGRGPVAAALGAQAGAVLGVVGTRIMGQFEGLTPTPRLLLVAPNIVAFERKTRVDQDDFRLWVCLHEQTHQFQFSHAPWLREHLQRLVADFLLRGGSPRDLGPITAVMTYLEGHAEFLMDEVGSTELATAPYLRTLLDGRRQSTSLATLLSRVVGLGKKLTQYEAGAAFCRALFAAGGLNMLNRPLSHPTAMPTAAEIGDPGAWLRRVG